MMRTMAPTTRIIRCVVDAIVLAMPMKGNIVEERNSIAVARHAFDIKHCGRFEALLIWISRDSWALSMLRSDQCKSVEVHEVMVNMHYDSRSMVTIRGISYPILSSFHRNIQSAVLSIHRPLVLSRHINSISTNRTHLLKEPSPFQRIPLCLVKSYLTQLLIIHLHSNSPMQSLPPPINSLNSNQDLSLSLDRRNRHSQSMQALYDIRHQQCYWQCRYETG